MKSLLLYAAAASLIAAMSFAFIHTLPKAIDKLTQHQTEMKVTYDNAQY